MNKVSTSALMFGSVLVIGAVSLAPRAQGKSEVNCESRKGKIALDAGKRHGQVLVEAAFDSLKRDCKVLGKLREFAKELKQAHPADQQERTDGQCRLRGVHQGIETAVKEIDQGCQAKKGAK